MADCKEVWLTSESLFQEAKLNRRLVLRILRKTSDCPMKISFDTGFVWVHEFEVESPSSLLILCVPHISSFITKLGNFGTFFEVTHSRNFAEISPDGSLKRCLIYVNRLKHLISEELTKDELKTWEEFDRRRVPQISFDENWLGRVMPLRNIYINATKFLESIEDINCDTLLSPPICVKSFLKFNFRTYLSHKHKKVKNFVILALLHNGRELKLFIPYFQMELFRLIKEEAGNNYVLLPPLKLIYEGSLQQPFVGFIWDPTLSGFSILPEENKYPVGFRFNDPLLCSEADMTYIHKKFGLNLPE